MASAMLPPGVDQDLHRCCLCWLPLFAYRSQPLPNGTVDWRAEVRALRSRRHRDDPFLTGVGYLLHRDLVASEDTDVHWTEDPSPPIHGKGHVYDVVSPYWSYQMHDFCWTTLLDRLTKGEPAKSPELRTLIIKLLFTLLSGMPFTPQGLLLPWNLSKHSTPVRFDHVTGTFKPGPPSDAVIAASNPASVTFAVQTSAEMPPGFENCLKLKERSESTQDGFAKLPAELRLLILSHLPSSEVCKLRLISRVIAQDSRPADLPQAFWFSRFCPGHELDFFPPPPRARNWRLLYRLIRHGLATKTPVWGEARNRRHIWNTMQPVFDCIKRVLDDMWFTRRLYRPRPPPPPSWVGGAFVRAERLIRDNSPSVGGTTRFAAMSLHFPRLQKPAAWYMGVTMFRVGGIKYISGLRILEAPDGLARAELAQETARAGWVSSEGESTHRIDIHPDSLVAIVVASTVNGIVGLSLIGRSTCTEAIYIGEYKASMSSTTPQVGSYHNGLGVTTLTAKNIGPIRGICVEVDVCKFTSIQILEERKEDPVAGQTSTERDVDALYKFGNPTHLWNPRVPRIGGTVQFPLSTDLRVSGTSPTMSSDYFLNMCFGGEDGSRLAHLTRIVAYMDGSRDAAIYGMGFYYDDSSDEVFFGARISLQNNHRTRPPRLAQISQAINGPGGERIDMLIATPACRQDSEYPETYTHNSTIRPFRQIRSLWMHTNHGRSFHFNMHYAQQHEEIPTNGLTKHYGLIVPEGEVMTSLMAKVKQGGGYFLEVGFQSKAIQEAEPTQAPWETPKYYRSLNYPVTDHNKRLAFSKNGNGGTEGLVVTSVDLALVRTIYVSGGESRSSPRYCCRRSSRVAGLKFEFWHTDEPVYVGQWFSQVDKISLARDERVTFLAVWHSRNMRTAPHSMSLYGKVRGVQVMTSKGQSMTCRTDSTDGRLKLSFRERPGMELAGLIWSFDHTIDHIQLVGGPRPAEQIFETVDFTSTIVAPEMGEDDAYDIFSTTQAFAEWTI